jgi:orotate phosphoribosyltransferase-like protein
MSKMNELSLDIEYLLNKGLSFSQIARELDIPVHFVIEAADATQTQPQQEDSSPFATINS